MKPKTLALLCVAVGCGLVAMIGVQQAMNKPAAAQVEMVQVLEAMADIDPGVPLSEENVAFREIQKDAIPEDCVTNLEEYQQRSLKVAVVKGEYILKSKLSEKGQSGKSIQIPIGRVVMTINVDETQTASNMMKAGDIVDVSVTYDARTPVGTQTKTMTLLECVTVFAIADQTKNDMVRRTDNNSLKARQVSLVVASEEANALQLAERKGQLRLVLRNPMDLVRRNTKAITENLLTELRGLDGGPGLPTNDEAPSEEPKTETTAVAAAPPADVHGFLAEPTPKQTVVEVKPVVEKAPAPKEQWEVKVFVGNEVQTYPFELPTTESNEGAPQADAGGLLEKLGWKLPWTAQKPASEGEKSTTNQAL